MKQLTLIKVAFLVVTVVASTVLIHSCTNSQSKDTKVIAEEHNDAKFENSRDEKDAQFLVNAADINLQEINLGQLAQQKGQTKDIQEMGKMMEDEHRKSLSDLTLLAKSKVITIPTSSTMHGQNIFNTLNEKSGNDFDKAYANLMVSGHKDAIETFEKASLNCSDSDIKNWATASLPDLRTHLDHALNCQKKCDIM